MVSDQFGALPEETRVIVRSAVNRINDIANNLLEKNRERRSGLPASAGASGLSGTTGGAPGACEAVVATSDSVQPHLLASLVDRIVSEKRLQFRDRMDVEIESALGPESYGLVAAVQPNELMRLLSNLVNNAVEALHAGSTPGRVTLAIEPVDQNRVALRVRDSGAGIPPEVLARLGQRGETHGKDGGSGLGLYHARATAESWGGALKIESRPGQGTTVSVILPKTATPEWFLPSLRLRPGQRVVVVDDDTSIHQVWTKRLKQAGASEKGVEIVRLAAPSALREWIRENDAARSNCAFLIDYEFLGHSENGLSLIEGLSLQKQATLVTSRFEEESVRQRCEANAVRLLPKGMAGIVPIVWEAQRARLDAVLIDDDELVHLTWKSVAGRIGKKLEAFTTPEAFFGVSARFDPESPVYIDSSLGNGVRGEDVAKAIRAAGFTRVYLATGHSADAFPPMPWLSGIVGKAPPWG